MSVWIVAEGSIFIVRDDTGGFTIIHTESMRIRSIDIAEVSTHSRDWTIFIGPATDRVSNRSIVLTGDRDRHCGRGSTTVAIIDGVSERVSRRFADSQTFKLSVRIVAERSIVIDCDQSRGVGVIHTEGMRIGRVDITEVRTHRHR